MKNICCRDPEQAASRNYDLIIIGGGIYGVAIAFEASRRGLASLVLEKSDFGGQTSFNSLRILHGGLRYLQKLDLKRFADSVGERQWFLKNMEETINPLPCLMPLYGKGLQRPAIFRLAFQINDFLSRHRNDGVPSQRHLPSCTLVDKEQTRTIYSQVPGSGLQGSAQWYDAVMPDSQLVLMEMLNRALQGGAVFLNYCEALTLLGSRSKTQGVAATDRTNGNNYDFRAQTVINAAGPWAREVGTRLHKDLPPLFYPSLAWNLLLNKPPLAEVGLAVSSQRSASQTYFLVPWKGRILAGTGHAAWKAGPENPIPTPEQVEQFLVDLNAAAPGLQAGISDIIHVFSGLLPVKEPGLTELTTRENIVEHAQLGGPEGLYSVVGVKFTTARLVADRLLSKIFPARPAALDCGRYTLVRQVPLRDIIAHSGVMHLDDLVLRRLPFPEDPATLISKANECCASFGWEENRRHKELTRVAEFFNMRQTDSALSEKTMNQKN